MHLAWEAPDNRAKFGDHGRRRLYGPQLTPRRAVGQTPTVAPIWSSACGRVTNSA